MGGGRVFDLTETQSVTTICTTYLVRGILIPISHTIASIALVIPIIAPCTRSS